MAPKMTSTARASAPLSSHPAFPAAIAVWFAALFGMGSMALRVQLLEEAVRALHLDLIVPAAAPPLGFTARLLVAVLFALFGAATGYGLARLVARRPRRAAPPRPVATAPKKAAAKAAVSAPAPTGDDNDDLARLEAARDAEPPRRRRLGSGLTAGDGGDPLAAPLPPTVPAPSILNLGELAVGDPLVFPAETPEPAGAFAQHGPAGSDTVDTGAEPASAAPLPFVPEPVAAATVAPLPVFAEPPASTAPAPSEPAISLLDINRRPSPPAEPAPSRAPAAEPVQAGHPAPGAVPAPASTRRLVPRAGTAAQVLRDVPVDTLGVVELVERFALALAERRERDTEAGPSRVPHASVDPAFVDPASVVPAPPPPVATVAPQTIAHLAVASATPQPATPAPMAVPVVAPVAVPAAAPRIEPAGVAPATGDSAVIARLRPAPPPREAVASPPPFADPSPTSPGAGRPFDMPRMLRPPMPGGDVEWFAREQDGDHHETLASLLPPRMTGVAAHMPRPARPAWDDEDVADDDRAGEDRDDETDDLADQGTADAGDRAIEQPDHFSSLLDMKPSVRPAPVDDVAAPPVRLPGAVLPGEPVVTEDALRSALAALQRMSGAA